MLDVEQVANQRQGRGHQGCAGYPEQRPGKNQHESRVGKRRRDRGQAKGAGTDQQQTPATNTVTQGAHGDEKARDHKPVDIQYPQQLCTGWFKVGAQARRRQVQHCHIQRQQQCRQHQNGQAQPFSAAGTGSQSGG